MEQPKITFSEWVKHPTTAMLVIAMAAVWLMTWLFTGSKNAEVESCKEESERWRLAFFEERQKTDALVKAFQVQKEAKTEVVKTVDSLKKKL